MRTNAQGVYRDRLVDSGLARRHLHGLLNHRVAEMVTTDDARPRIGRQGLTREHPEPSQLAAGVWILSFQRIGYPDTSKSGSAVALMERLDLLQLRAECLSAGVGQERRAIFVPLATAHEQQSLIEVDVLDAELAALRDTKSAAVDQGGHQPARASERAQEGGGFRDDRSSVAS